MFSYKENSASLLICALLFIGCNERDSSFSLLPDQEVFNQSKSELEAKIDILWVIDDSGSMATSQQNVADNFNLFINDFVAKNLDFNIAVTSTGAWKDPFTNNTFFDSRFRDGDRQSTSSGVFVVNPSTPDLIPTILTNMLIGINGTGDERPFMSLTETLNNPLNTDFLRPDSHLAIIIVTDEDDFSHDGQNSIGHDYNYAGLHSIQSYMDYLDTLTDSTGASRRYSVSGIGIWDEACKTLLTDEFPNRLIAQRVGELVAASGGVTGSLCGNFGQELSLIAENILELSTQFFLARQPIPETIIVHVGGNIVPQSSSNGWTYNPEAISIVFHGSAIPSQGSSILVDFDPVTIK